MREGSEWDGWRWGGDLWSCANDDQQEGHVLKEIIFTATLWPHWTLFTTICFLFLSILSFHLVTSELYHVCHHLSRAHWEIPDWRFQIEDWRLKIEDDDAATREERRGKISGVCHNMQRSLEVREPLSTHFSLQHQEQITKSTYPYHHHRPPPSSLYMS